MIEEHRVLVRTDDPTPMVLSNDDGSLRIEWAPRTDLDARRVTPDWPRFVAISRELLEAWVAELSAHRVAEQRRARRWWRRWLR